VRYHIQHFSCAANSVPLGEIQSNSLISKTGPSMPRYPSMPLYKSVYVNSKVTKSN